jgi:hypothetical protein
MQSRFWIGIGIGWLALAWALPGGAQTPVATGSDTPVAVAPTGSVSPAGEPQSPKPTQHPLFGALFALALPPFLVLGGVSLGALLTLIHIFWPRLVQREYEVLIECPGRALGWGIGWGVGYLVLFVLLSKAVGLGQLLAVLLSLATLAALFLGLAGTAFSLGGQVLALARPAGASPLARLAAGSALIVLVAVFPLFGPLLVLYLLLLGLGAFRLAVTSLPLPAPAPAEEPPPAPGGNAP